MTEPLETRLARLEAALGRAIVTRGGGDAPALLPGTGVRCTEEVRHRLDRVPIASVRRVVAEQVAERARAAGVAHVDLAFFERAATF